MLVNSGMITTASTFNNSHSKVPLVLLGIFIFIWVWSFQGTLNIFNWMLENTLTILFGIFLFNQYKKQGFSDLSYICIFIYMVMHLYGAKYTYAETPAGNWLRDMLGWERNNYDRIVHFGFGFFLAYPWREYFMNSIKISPSYCWFLPAEITLSFAGIYELVEWMVADKFFPDQGIAYLGAQGDVWDAQKDMGLALLGAVIALTLIFVAHIITHRRYVFLTTPKIKIT